MPPARRFGFWYKSDIPNQSIKANRWVANEVSGPDYQLKEELLLTRREQLKAIAGLTRSEILGLLGQRAMTTQQLAGTLAVPKGTVAHHLKVLQGAGLIRVVRRRQVRAITEKYYGRVARLFRISADDCAPCLSVDQVHADAITMPFRVALAEMLPEEASSEPSTTLLHHARLTRKDAAELGRRLEALATEFSSRATDDGRAYGFVGGIYRARSANGLDQS